VSSQQQPIDFDLFRKKYNIPASNARSIIKALGLEVIRDGMKQLVVGYNKYKVDNTYLLKHAVLEWRTTMNIDNTLAGNFFEFSVVGDRVEGLIGVSNIPESAVKPKTPSQKRVPNDNDGSFLIKSEKQLSQIAPAEPIKIKTTSVGEDLGVIQPDALTALITALAGAQREQQEDILHTQKQLLEASQQRYRLTTEQLAKLLGYSKQTIASKKSGFIRLGFKYEKVKEGASTLWVVTKIID